MARFSANRQQFWFILRRKRGGAITKVFEELELTRGGLKPWLKALEAHQYLELTEYRLPGEPHRSDLFKLLRDTGPIAPMLRSDGTLYDANLAGEIEFSQQRLWMALRIGRALEAQAAADLAHVSYFRALAWLRSWWEYGYCTRSGSQSGKAPITYRICQDRPFCPVVVRGSGVFDVFKNKFVEKVNG